MKPAAFEIARAANLREAAALLAGNDEARIIAGGQSLGPMLNLRLAQPKLLIDITGIAALTRVENTADHITLGACITTADIEDGRVDAADIAMLESIAGRIAYRAVRNRGTVGGSVCHADPAADWITALSALGADVIITDGAAQRRTPIAGFVASAFTTDLKPGEIVEAIRIPKPSRRARWGYYKVCRKAGEFALAASAVLSDPDRGVWRAVMGAMNGAPIVIDDASLIFGGAPEPGPAVRVDEEAVGRLLAASQFGLDPVRRRLHLTALARAAEEARRR
jgi:carbon-monoxide dehydrogenase medium subunit